MHLSLLQRRAKWIISCFKNLDRKRLSLSLGPKRAWRVMNGSTPDHTHPPSRQQAAVGGSRASSKALLMHPLHCTLRPLSPPWARSLHYTSLPHHGYIGGPLYGGGLYGILVPGSCPAVSLEVLGVLAQEVVNTITSARAPSTRNAYALKWNLFIEWCSSHREDPRKCPIRVVLSFLQQGL